MKKLFVSVLALAGVMLSEARATDFSDIQYWVGSGANQAALVIDWNDGKSPESLVWGYRWDGTANGEDMFRAVVNADPRLFANINSFSFGNFLTGIGYDLNGNSVFGVSPSVTFDGGGITDSAADDSRVPTDAGDHYREGFNSGFWNYYTKESAAGPWGSSSVGFTDRTLSNGSWDGYSFWDNFFSGSEPGDPVAAVPPVPEPSVMVLGLAGGAILMGVRIRNGRRQADVITS